MEIQTYLLVLLIFFNQRGRPLLVVVGDIESEVVGHLTTDSVCNKHRVIRFFFFSLRLVDDFNF